jgi:2-dehydro-3-deoxyphosphogluconate aldolase/(4S)-4-hydroxy-2-oxoglutarate aldolase
VPLVATGGLNAENAGAFLEGGAIAVTAGSGVVGPKLAAESRFDEISARAKEFLAAVRLPGISMRGLRPDEGADGKTDCG